MSDEKWPHADLALQWYSAPPGTLEWRETSVHDNAFDDIWVRCDPPAFKRSYLYEIRPIRKMEILPEARVPAPLRIAPEMGTEYWTLFGGDMVSYDWDDDKYDHICLQNGLAFATEQDARDFLKAITARREE